MSKWKATDMHFVQVWNPSAGYQPEKRNFTLYAMIYKTPEGESIILSINVFQDTLIIAKETQKRKKQRHVSLFYFSSLFNNNL